MPIVPQCPSPDSPLVVAYGLGVNSTAMLVEFIRRRIRPHLILFADTGGEKPETYAYLDVIRPFLATAGFPDVITVRYQPKRAAYATLESQCLHTRTLPSLAYGGRSCSLKYKRQPQDRYVANWTPAQQCWRRGKKVLKAIGFDASSGDRRRANHAGHFDDPLYEFWYPLIDWRLDRARCMETIAAAGLPIPLKSSCFYCPAMKKEEVVWLQEHHPELLERALRIERQAQPGLRTVKGLGRSFSWAEFVARINNLPLFDSCTG